MNAIVAIPMLLMILNVGSGHAGNSCPIGTTPKTWDEVLFSISGKAHGCVDADGKRQGVVVATDEEGREIISGTYQNGLRDGVWAIQVYSREPDGLTSERMEFWFDEGVNRAIEGGRLAKLVSARGGTFTSVGAEEVRRVDRPQIEILAIERLVSGWCEDCPSYAVEVHRGGRVDFIGYSGIAPLGPKCGRLRANYAGTILRLAARANLPEMRDGYFQEVRHPGRLIVLAKGRSFEKLVSVEGGGSPVELFDLARVIEMAIPHVRWDCRDELVAPE